MATIKDVAALAKVSTATVSLVLNGLGDEKKVAPSTQAKVLDAAKRLDYRPNTSARNLRTQASERPVIAFYWPIDQRISYLSSILSGMRSQIEKQHYQCDLVVCTYKNDHLSDESAIKAGYNYNAIIIGAPSENDMNFLEELDTRTPIILYNRHSEKYHWVCSEDEKAICSALEILSSKGHKRLCLLKPDSTFTISGKRLSMIHSFAEKLGLTIEKNSIFSTEDSYDGGAVAARRYLNLDNPPTAIFSMSEAIAIGAVSTFNKKNLVVPTDVEVVSLGLGDPNLTRFVTPSLSVIEMPSIEMAENCIDVAKQVIEKTDIILYQRHIPSKLILRESCPE